MSAIQSLVEAVRQEALREEFPIDAEVYERYDLEPTKPILYAGSLTSRLGFFARDLGKDEVKAGQPLYGAAGRLVRRGVFQAVHGKEASGKADHESILENVLLTNTVPYKPLGNKAYRVAVKKRFRPFLEELLLLHWEGDILVTLGNEALQWFKPYGDKAAFTEFSKSATRYEETFTVTIKSSTKDKVLPERQVTLAPLPHPSPLNQQYYSRFPQMLQDRLTSLQPF